MHTPSSYNPISAKNGFIAASLRLTGTGVKAVGGEPEGAEGNPTRELVSEMRGHLENILKDAELAAVLLALLRGEYNNVPRLPKSVHKLEDMGLATIGKIPYYNAKPGSGNTRRKRRR